MFSYNYRNGYALLTYMEYPIILIQELILIYFVVYYKGHLGVKSFLGAGVYFVNIAAFLYGIYPREFLAFLVVCFFWKVKCICEQFLFLAFVYTCRSFIKSSTIHRDSAIQKF